jgi:aerobic-type carbon monoxide dehydrogenase small subunit (CoxS/CutS family)
MHKSNTDRRRRGAVSRRGFIKGAGVAAAGAALAEGGLAALAQEKQSPGPRILGPGEIPVKLNINGQDKLLKLEPRTTLAEALRLNLDMTGTKIVCDRGACSACTVWLDDVPVNSCMTLALDARGKKIRTIEGLADGENLHPVQQQFIEHDAMQCGFCTPGMVMSCAALLNANKNPTLDDVKNATCGNLCRCGTYPKVFDATLAAAKQISEGGNGHA